MIRTVLVRIFRAVIGVYFRTIEVAGAVPSSTTGGRLFVSNHVNALVDPILVLTRAPCAISPVAKSTLWKIPGLRWLLDAADAVPIVRRRDDPNKQSGANDAAFERVAAWLAGGRNILIFPEGTSHNEPQLQEVKTGAARMLARAHARTADAVGRTPLTFQAVALEFDERASFRSRCLLLYGPVHDVAEYAAGDDEALVGAITEALRADLSELLVEGATWPDRVLIARVAQMLANDSGDRTLANWNAIGRQVEAARKALAGAGERDVDEVRAAVDAYFDGLDDEGFVDEQLAHGGEPGPSRRGGSLLALALPFAAIGAVLYATPYWLTRLVALRVKDADEVSTIKLGAGLLFYPLWTVALVVVAALLAPWPYALGAGVSAVACAFAALAWLDEAPRLGRAVRLKGASASGARDERIRTLREARAGALATIERVRTRLAAG